MACALRGSGLGGCFSRGWRHRQDHVDREPGALGGHVGHGRQLATDVDVLDDLLLVQYDAKTITNDPFSNLIQTAEEAYLGMADCSSILRPGGGGPARGQSWCDG